TNQLTFLAKQGQASPPDQTIQVTNSGGRVLSWFSTITTTDGANWLSLTPDHGSTTSAQSASTGAHVSLAGLAVGMYTGTVTVAGMPGTSGAPQQVAVSLEVDPPPLVPLDLHVSADAPAYEINAPIRISAALSQGSTAIANATLQAMFDLPDGSKVPAQLTYSGAGGIYTVTLRAGATAGRAALYVSASTPQGFTSQAAIPIIITGHNLTFAGSQTFPGTIKQSSQAQVV